MQGFDKTSNIWLEPFSTLINCMLPVEYVYADWFGWQTNSEAWRADSESLFSLSEDTIEAGSRVEGFCIPQFILRKSDIGQGNVLDIKEHWQSDRDLMTANDPFVESDEKTRIPIFIVEHLDDDPKFAKLRLTKEWKEHRPRYWNVSYLHQSFLLPSADHPMHGCEWTNFDGKKSKWSYTLHGPVRKLKSNGFPSDEEDQTGVFKYPTAWPEPAMEWLVRPRPSGWPSAELIQDIFDSGCHLAPRGRGRRLTEPVEMLNYCQNPELYAAGSSVQASPSVSNDGKWIMDNTEWKTSFSVAENKLGASVSPVQRHVMVMLKMIKKFYFPKVISTYCLKTILFWECETKQEAFWKEDNSANCVLLMLDRLHECLESHLLPHFFIPRSNILQYEDPAKLNEAAAIVAEVRRKILSKTVNLLKRLLSLSYQSHTYLGDVGLQLHNHLLRMQDKSLSEEDQRELLRFLHSIFVGKCKNVIESLERIMPVERQNIEKLLNVSLYAYESILARNLCKLWFLVTKTNASNDERETENDFKSFVKTNIKDLSLDDEFIALSLVFFDSTRNGMEPSMAISSTRTMKNLKEEQMKIAVENVENSLSLLKGTFDWLKASDMKKIGEKVSKKLRETRPEGTTITKEEIERSVKLEIAALYEERMKENK